MFDPNAKFLVIDDFKTMRSIVKRTLQTMGYSNVEEAEDGAKAHEMILKSLINNQPYDCIVSDWNMPNMSGLELLKKVRENSSTKDVPFMLVTAENEQKQVIEAAKAGVSNYIVKPFTPADFQKKLEAVWVRHNKAKAA